MNPVCQNAASHGFKIHLHGKACHAARPHQGVDAIAMAVRVYSDIQIMRTRELNPIQPAIISIGEIHGGKTNNVVCDYVMMHGTIRTHDNALDNQIFKRITDIAQSVDADMGAEAAFQQNICRVTVQK